MKLTRVSFAIFIPRHFKSLDYKSLFNSYLSLIQLFNGSSHALNEIRTLP